MDAAVGLLRDEDLISDMHLRLLRAAALCTCNSLG